MPHRITILGDGAMATVCSILLASRGHAVTIWGALEECIERLQQDREQHRLLPGVRIPASVHLTANESDCFNDATLIINAIPTQYMRASWKRLAPYLPAGLPIISVAKGIESDSLLLPTQIIADVLGGKPSVGAPPTCAWPLAVLSGPNIAAELARYLPATAVIASRDPAVAELVQGVISTQWFRVYTNSDVTGVELSAAVKNVIAIAAGIIDGLGAGTNAKAALVTRGLVEITRLGLAMGAQEATFHGLAGLGDLVTTCVSPEGRNRRVGEQIGKGRKLREILDEMESVAEGVPTTKAVAQLADRCGVDMPITRSVHAVLFEGRDVLTALTDLMSRDPKPETGHTTA